MCLGIQKPDTMAINALSFTWNNYYFYISIFQSCRLNISDDLQREGKYSDSCTRLVNPILVPAVTTDDQPGPVVFLAVTKKLDIATQNIQVPPSMQKTAVNSNQGNNTTENYLHIASIIIILNSEHLILKIYVMY